MRVLVFVEAFGSLTETRVDDEEYVDYLEILGAKRKDYYARSVLQFDDDFRGRAVSEKLRLNDNAAREECAASHFHAATCASLKIQAAALGSAYAFSGTFDRPFAPLPPVCGRFNSDAGCVGAYSYRHECKKCHRKDHTARNSPQTRSQNN